MLTQHGGLATGDLADLRAVLFAGEVFPTQVPARADGAAARTSAFWNLYGPTETNVCTCLRRAAEAPDRDGRRIPIGRPIAGVEPSSSADGRRAGRTRARSASSSSRGPTVMQGYWGDPERTARRLVADPLARGRRPAYRTGDLVAEERGGDLRFLGRRDHQIKSRGIPDRARRDRDRDQCPPGVVECAVVAVPTNSSRTESWPTSSPAPDLDDGKLAAWCADFDTEIHGSESFVFVDLLPKTSTGKIDRQAVSKRLSELKEREGAPHEKNRLGKKDTWQMTKDGGPHHRWWPGGLDLGPPTASAWNHAHHR